MIKRVYEFIKSFITENYLILLSYLVLYVTLTYPLPYYIYTSGGLIEVDSKIIVSNKTKSKGSYNMCYVEQLQANIPTYIMSFFKKDWEVVSYDELTVNKKESKKEIEYRDKLYLNDATNNALISALKEADIKYTINSSNPIATSILNEAKTDIEIGDEIIKLDNIKISSREDIANYLEDKEIGTKVSVTVINNNKKYKRYAKVILYEDSKILGLSILNKIDITTKPNIKFNFSDKESGPSGGFMISLALYDYLVKDDISKGYKISGTGTIDENGNVGAIGGVKYKLKGAVKKKADIFFVPIDNYKEAIKLKKKKNYKIKVVGVSTLKDAINYLNNQRTLEK